MSKRSWTRSHRRTTFLPSEILIAGVDFECTDDDPLRDEPSDGRRAHDDRLVTLLRRGFFGSILVTSREIDGSIVPVVVDGRQRVRLSRLVNAERKEKGLQPWQWTVEHRPPCGSFDFEQARVLNQGRVAETQAQRIRYFQRFVAQGSTEEDAAELLGFRQGQIKAVKAVGDGAADWIMDALDLSLMGLSAAAMVAIRPGDEQERVRVLIGDDPPTTKRVREALATIDGRPLPQRRGKKEIKRALEEAGDGLPDLFRAGVEWALGERDTADTPLAACSSEEDSHDG